MKTETVNLHVEGMTCTNCALTIRKTLEKKGLSDIQVNYLTAEVSFSEVDPLQIKNAVDSINQLGYHAHLDSDSSVSDDEHLHKGHHHGTSSSLMRPFFFSLAFTLPLFLHMLIPFPILHQPIFQLIISLPVMFIGVKYFGKSAFFSLKSGVPNMDVLIITGVLAAFTYSLSGILLYGIQNAEPYLFFETAATIVTLVLLGNLIEERSVKQTTTAIAELKNLQPAFAKRLNRETGLVEEIKTELLLKNDIILVNTGDRIAQDGVVQLGAGTVNESMITGESIPVNKTNGNEVTGGSILETGSLKIRIERIGQETTLSKIIQLVKNAQHTRPEIQKLGDRISSVFVPVVFGISLLTFIIAHFYFHRTISQSLMQSIAVLVISCPCAMGLATPTAVMVGIGRAAKKGILIKGGSTLEQLAKIKTIVFDKTGTLTTGNFKIENINCEENLLVEIKSVLYSIELHSSHPIARSIVSELQSEIITPIQWKSVEEDKGTGINATDENGNLYSVGSFRMVEHLQSNSDHSVYILKNNQLIATVDLTDELKPDTIHVIRELKKLDLKIVLLSGDRKFITEKIAKDAGIDIVYSEKKPNEKLAIIKELNSSGLVAMVGDGINDAPALATADVGISISDATEVAIQSAQVILLAKHNLNILLPALKISKLTYSTIKQNLFWAFFYNVLAIPIAAAGYLSPMIAAFSMAFSDVVVIGNSIRLKTRKLNS